MKSKELTEKIEKQIGERDDANVLIAVGSNFYRVDSVVNIDHLDSLHRTVVLVSLDDPISGGDLAAVLEPVTNA